MPRVHYRSRLSELFSRRKANGSRQKRDWTAVPRAKAGQLLMHKLARLSGYMYVGGRNVLVSCTRIKSHASVGSGV